MLMPDFDAEQISRAYLEVLALARQCAHVDQDPASDPDGAQRNAVIAGMDLPRPLYLSAAGILLAQLAARIGPADVVLDDAVRSIVANAARSNDGSD